LSYGLLDCVFNLAAGRNIGLKMSKQNILFKANSLILMSLKKDNQWPRNPRKDTKIEQRLSGSGFGGSGFKVQRRRWPKKRPVKSNKKLHFCNKWCSFIREVRRKHMRIERFKDIEEWQLVRELTRKVSEIPLYLSHSLLFYEFRDSFYLLIMSHVFNV